MSPEHKIRIVRAWQDRGNLVAMTGDGVNDAPALKQADIGVAMGITGTEVAKDAAGMVLADDNFATIVQAVKNGRNVYANIKRAIQFLLSGNAAGILTVLYASLAALPVPFAAVHLLFINLLTDSLPAIALGLEPHTDEVMREKPRPRSEGILTTSLPHQRGGGGPGHRPGHHCRLPHRPAKRRRQHRQHHGLCHPVPQPPVPRLQLQVRSPGALYPPVLLTTSTSWAPLSSVRCCWRAVLLIPPLEPLFQVAPLSGALAGRHRGPGPLPACW